MYYTKHLKKKTKNEGEEENWPKFKRNGIKNMKRRGLKIKERNELKTNFGVYRYYFEFEIF